MSGEKQCWTCIYGINSYGLHCTNKYVHDDNTDPYDCEFYDGISDDYVKDMYKVIENT